MNRQGRLILLPLGHEWPGKDDRVFSMEQLLDACGGDLDTVMKAEPNMGCERFIANVTVPLFDRHGNDEIIVALAPRESMSMSMGEILSTRAWLEGEIPFLAHALWLLFVNEGSEFFFLEQMKEQGTLDGKISIDEPPPEWTLTRYQEQKFLVLSTRASNLDEVATRADEHFQRVRFKRASPHPATIPAPSDPPRAAQHIQIPRPPANPSFSGLKLKPKVGG